MKGGSVKTTDHLIASERGSVMLEFCLVLPIYLLLFGGTFLTFDVSMGRLHLQEANRNLAWIENDRYDSGKQIRGELYKRVTAFYEARNKLEKQWAPGQDFWTFGSGKQDSRTWGHQIGSVKEDGVNFKADNDFLALHSGNMELKMEKISAVYIGAVGVSSVLMPNDRDGAETTPLYRSVFVFTRASDDKGNAKSSNGEMLLVRRGSGGEKRSDVKDANSLLTEGIMLSGWPSDGNPVDTVKTILGI